MIVSNEAGLSVIPHTPIGRDFQKAQGQLNQQLASVANRVVFVVSGLPLLLKVTWKVPMSDLFLIRHGPT